MRAFVIAMESEVAAVRPHLCGDDLLIVSGVGKVNAAAATARAIAAGATEVWNAGVAGGFDDDLAVGECVEIARAVEYDFDLSQLNGTEVGVHNERESPYFSLATVGRLTARTLGTGDHFSDSTADFPLLRRLGVGVRDMEGAAIAHVCESARVPCHSVKAITNTLGGGAHGQYRANLELALANLSKTLGELLR